jgi:hypothetical protein
MIQDGREENPQVASASGRSDSGAKSSSRSGFGIERKAVLELVVGHLDRYGSAKSKSLKSIEVRISDESKNHEVGPCGWLVDRHTSIHWKNPFPLGSTASLRTIARLNRKRG